MSGRLPLFHCVRLSVARRVGGPFPVLHCVGLLLCPAGHERSLGLGLEPSPPTRLRVRPSRDVPRWGPSLCLEPSPPTRLRVRSRLGRETSRGGAPRCSYEATPATPHRETPARFPHAPARWLLTPPGRISPPHPVRRGPAQQVWGMSLGGRRNSAGAAGGQSLRSPRAPDARAVLGRRRRGFMRTPRGPGADRALRSRAKESAGAGRGGAQACSWPPRHRQKTSLTQ